MSPALQVICSIATMNEGGLKSPLALLMDIPIPVPAYAIAALCGEKSHTVIVNKIIVVVICQQREPIA